MDIFDSSRYQFFTEQRNFIKSLTDLCEDLRKKDVNIRQSILPSYLKNIKTYNNLGQAKEDSVPALTKQF